MTRATLGTVTLTVEAGRGRLSEVACRACPTCLSGQPLWCADPVSEPVQRLEWAMTAGASPALSALACSAAFARADVSSDHAVLVLGDDTWSTLVTLIEGQHGGSVLVAVDPRDPDVTSILAANRPAGRADVVVTPSRVRAAVKAVRRGGRVCTSAAADTDVDMPTITEVVQREVAIVGAGDVVGTALEVGADGLTELFDRPSSAPN
jgi:hypothetical protein